MSLKNTKVLVTGADGFIGSHLAEHLVMMGADVSAFVFYNSFDSCGWLDTLPSSIRESMRIVRGDIRDPHLVTGALQGCDVYFHLAALISIPFSYVGPATFVDTNIGGTLNILQAARSSSVGRVIQTSTSEVYGSAQYVPIDEKHPLNAQSPYAASKTGADQLALAFHRSFGVPVTIIRPFNTYGPRQSARAIIPTIITQLASGAEEIKLGALTPTRDLTFVADTVAGFVAAATAPAVEGEVFNLGSDFEITVGDLAELIASIMDKKVSFISSEERVRPEASEVNRLWACTEKARQILGWTPANSGLTGLKVGLTRTIEWFSRPENLQRYHPERYAI
jgi:NAD dependent epimerase/dehydratase